MLNVAVDSNIKQIEDFFCEIVDRTSESMIHILTNLDVVDEFKLDSRTWTLGLDKIKQRIHNGLDENYVVQQLPIDIINLSIEAAHNEGFEIRFNGVTYYNMYKKLSDISKNMIGKQKNNF